MIEHHHHRSLVQLWPAMDLSWSQLDLALSVMGGGSSWYFPTSATLQPLPSPTLPYKPQNNLTNYI